MKNKRKFEIAIAIFGLFCNLSGSKTEGKFSGSSGPEPRASEAEPGSKREGSSCQLLGCNKKALDEAGDIAIAGYSKENA